MVLYLATDPSVTSNSRSAGLVTSGRPVTSIHDIDPSSAMRMRRGSRGGSESSVEVAVLVAHQRGGMLDRDLSRCDASSAVSGDDPRRVADLEAEVLRVGPVRRQLHDDGRRASRGIRIGRGGGATHENDGHHRRNEWPPRLAPSGGHMPRAQPAPVGSAVRLRRTCSRLTTRTSTLQSSCAARTVQWVRGSHLSEVLST